MSKREFPNILKMTDEELKNHINTIKLHHELNTWIYGGENSEARKALIEERRKLDIYKLSCVYVKDFEEFGKYQDMYLNNFENKQAKEKIDYYGERIKIELDLLKKVINGEISLRNFDF